MATVTKSIGTTGRDYSTITAWEADLDNAGVYSAADDAVGECYDDSAFDEEVTVNGGETIGLTNVHLTVAIGERHDGTEGTGARNVLSSKSTASTIDLVLDNVELSWLEYDENGKSFTAGTCIKLTTSAGTMANIVSKTICHGLNVTTGSPPHGINVSKNDAGTASVLNNIVYDITHSSRKATGIELLNVGSTRTYNCMNNTVHGITGDHATEVVSGFEFGDQTPTTVQNCVSTNSANNGAGSALDYSQAAPANATVDHNLASDTSASGTGSLDSKTSSDQFVSTVSGSEDLHLKAGADAIDAGVDLSTTPSGVEIDINGRDRDAEMDTWDMGAHEFGAATVSPGVLDGQAVHNSTYQNLRTVTAY